MRKIYIFIIIICCLLTANSCSYDNFDEPKSMLTGKAIYNGEPVSVRSGSSEFALFQDGYALHGSIPVYIAQDGSYSVNLFNGDYKLVRVGNAPWERPSNDTIRITVKGNTIQDIPVTPYFFIKDVSFTKSNNKIVAKFTVNKVIANANMEDVSLYLGKGILTDNNQKEATLSLGNKIPLEQETSAEIDIPNNLINKTYIYARIGVKSDKSSEYCYSQSIKVELKLEFNL